MFVFTFFKIYTIILLKISPLVIFLLLIIVVLGWLLARLEGWSLSRGLYCAFITATTVGYGVVHPTKPKTRFISIVIAVSGLLLTGMLVALAYQSLQMAASYSGLVDDLQNRFPDVSEGFRK